MQFFVTQDVSCISHASSTSILSLLAVQCPVLVLSSASKRSIRRFVNNSVLNVKAVVAAFNQEKTLVGAFSVMAKSSIFTKVHVKL